MVKWGNMENQITAQEFADQTHDKAQTKGTVTPTETSSSEHAGLGIALGVMASVAVLAYDFKALHYSANESLFPVAIGIPTLGLAILYVATESARAFRAKHARRDRSLADKDAGEFSEFTERTGEIGRRRALAIGFAVIAGYVAFLTTLGFAIDSLLTIVGIPMLLGLPRRNVPYLLLTAVILVGGVEEILRLSGVVALPGGVFGAYLP